MRQGESYAGARVTIMGLGLHGGGAAAARYFVSAGADVTVTDLRSEGELASSLEGLAGLPIRYVLGAHEESDFEDADIVVKNPAVPRSSRYLARARRIETDISIFLSRLDARLVAVTGTKGKSSTSAAVHHILSQSGIRSHLGGNITRSPLAFTAEVGETDTVVLELSSFQLGDLALTPAGVSVLKPRVAVITSIFRDHLNYYRSMEEYVADKRQIYAAQQATDWTLARSDDWGRSFLAETPARGAVLADEPPAAGQVGAYLDGRVGIARLDTEEEIVPEKLSVPGLHMRRNLLAAGLASRLLGVSGEDVRAAAGSFTGIGHRLELVRERNGVRFYNDSAATIPEATLEAVSSFEGPVHLIAGGTDKNIDFALFGRIAGSVAGLYLLDGTATGAILRATASSRDGAREDAAPAAAPGGPYASLEEAVEAAARNARPGEIVILSPGCASFGMFDNEFDRGRRFRTVVEGL